jgi:hypothetical protein
VGAAFKLVRFLFSVFAAAVFEVNIIVVGLGKPVC